jgi:hypothetical protein
MFFNGKQPLLFWVLSASCFCIIVIRCLVIFNHVKKNGMSYMTSLLPVPACACLLNKTFSNGRQGFFSRERNGRDRLTGGGSGHLLLVVVLYGQLCTILHVLQGLLGCLSRLMDVLDDLPLLSRVDLVFFFCCFPFPVACGVLPEWQTVAKWFGLPQASQVLPMAGHVPLPVCGVKPQRLHLPSRVGCLLCCPAGLLPVALCRMRWTSALSLPE